MPENYLELLLKVHDYLSDSYHSVFFLADLKHAYYTVHTIPLYLDDREVFAFTILRIDQLQPICIP